MRRGSGRRKSVARVEDISAYLVPDDERVEDAALTDEDVIPGVKTGKQIKAISQVYA